MFRLFAPVLGMLVFTSGSVLAQSTPTPSGVPAPRVAAPEAGQNPLTCDLPEGPDGKPQAPAKSTRVKVNVNTATCTQLLQLQGVDIEKARLWVSGRPYTFANDLVGKGVLTAQELDRIRAQLTFTGATSPLQPEQTAQPIPREQRPGNP